MDLYRGDMEAGANLSVPTTRFNKTPGRGRVFTYLSLDLNAVKGVKAAHPGMTVNDVMVSVIGGGMRHYFDAHGEPVEGCMGATIPKDVRKGEESNDISGNKVGGLFIRIHNEIEDPVERLQAVHASVAQASEFSQKIDLDSIFPQMMDDPEFYIECCQRSFDELQEATDKI